MGQAIQSPSARSAIREQPCPFAGLIVQRPPRLDAEISADRGALLWRQQPGSVVDRAGQARLEFLEQGIAAGQSVAVGGVLADDPLDLLRVGLGDVGGRGQQPERHRPAAVVNLPR